MSFHKAHSSRGLGHLPLKEEITGPNPVCATKHQLTLEASTQYIEVSAHLDSNLLFPVECLWGFGMQKELILETTTRHLVRPLDLNHHGTLFAGQMASWFVEAGFIAAASLGGKPDDIVCVQLNDMLFKKPVHLGDIIMVKTKMIQIMQNMRPGK